MKYSLTCKSLIIAAVIALTACRAEDKSTSVTGLPSVTVIRTKESVLEINQELPGRVHAVRTAEVRARVAGIVLKREFTEGAEVKEGDILFQIDPAPFETDLARAEAEAKRAEAVAADAKSKLTRSVPLAKINAISQQDLVTAQTTYKAALANAEVARANVRASRLNLEYATVRAPVSGRIGRSSVTEGALVGQGGAATPMATIQQIDRVFVDLTQPAADAIALQEAVKADSVKSRSNRIVAHIEGTQKSVTGKLLFTDISVDPTSGQLVLRGEFPNPDYLLLPGMYVRVSVSKGIVPDAILVPQRAVSFDADGAAGLWVVNKNGTAERRTVRTGGMYGADWHITEGITAGELVIVGGTEVTAGQKVSITEPSGN